MKITVFTPTYNRVQTIERLYKSLCRQKGGDFEWVIVDDCSTDNTSDKVAKWSAAAPFPIRYYKMEVNGGKHRAINRGVAVAMGDLFFIVDSDDYLTDDAISWITEQAHPIMGNPQFAGISGTRIYPDGTRIGGNCHFEVIDADAMSIRFKHHIKGDLAEVYKTDVMRRFPFPDIEDETFCTEGLIWGRIAREYQLRYINRGIYIGEYLDGGLTDNSLKYRLNNPQYAMLAYSEFVRHPQVSIMGKIRYYINFWLYSYCTQISFGDKLKRIGVKGSVFAPLGYVFYLKARRHR